MNQKSLLKEMLSFLVTLATPFILIFGGAGLAGLGIEYELLFLLVAGGLVFLAGLIWCIWVLFIHGD